jgi:hypothetical protein
VQAAILREHIPVATWFRLLAGGIVAGLIRDYAEPTDSKALEKLLEFRSTHLEFENKTATRAGRQLHARQQSTKLGHISQ